MVVATKGGKKKTLRYGDAKMEIKRDDPEARKSFRSRHDCKNAKDKHTAAYWSCRNWRSSKKVEA